MSRRGERRGRGRLLWHDFSSCIRRLSTFPGSLGYLHFRHHHVMYHYRILSFHYIPQRLPPRSYLSCHISYSHLLGNDRQRSLRFHLTKIHPPNTSTTPNPLHMSFGNRQNPLRARIRSGGRTSRSFSIGVRMISRQLR